MARSLLIRPDKAGDAIKSLPAIRALKYLRRDMSIDVLCSTHNESIFAVEPEVSAICLPPKWETLGDLPSELFKRLLDREYDRVVCLAPDVSESMVRLLDWCPGKVRLAAVEASHSKVQQIQLPNGTPALREEELNIALILDAAFGTKTSQMWNFMVAGPVITEQDVESAAVLSRDAAFKVAVFPFAGDGHRSHPVSRWNRLVRVLGFVWPKAKFYLFGASSERTRLEAFRDGCGLARKRIEIGLLPNFRSLGAYLLQMDRVIAVDSGPLHLAISLAVPGLGLMSGGDRRRWFSNLTTSKQVIVRRGVFGRYPELTSIIKGLILLEVAIYRHK